jgi:hypothetical protein
MHTYLKSTDENTWTVGHYIIIVSEQTWVSMKDFTSERAAAAYTNYLNGGGASDVL